MQSLFLSLCQPWDDPTYQITLESRYDIYTNTQQTEKTPKKRYECILLMIIHYQNLSNHAMIHVTYIHLGKS